METVLGFAIHAPNGQGSIRLYSAGRLCKQAGCTSEEIAYNLNKINSMWSSPMPLHRIQNIMKQFN